MQGETAIVRGLLGFPSLELADNRAIRIRVLPSSVLTRPTEYRVSHITGGPIARRGCREVGKGACSAEKKSHGGNTVA